MTLHIGQLVECIDAGPGYATGRPIDERKTDISELEALLNPSPEDCCAVLYGDGQ